MKCEKCGNLLNGTEKFCNGCGSPVNTVNNVASSQNTFANTDSNFNNNFGGASLEQNNNMNSFQDQTASSSMSYMAEKKENVSNLETNFSEHGSTPSFQGLNNSSVQSNVANGNGIPYSYNYKEPKKSNGPLIFVMIIITLLLCVGTGVGVYFLTSSDKEEKEEKKENVVTPTPTSISSIAKFNGKNFVIPEDVDYEVANDKLKLANDDWVAQIQVTSQAYSLLVKNKSLIEKNFLDYGYKVNDSKEIKVQNKNYLYFSLTDQNNRAVLAAYREDSASTVYVVTIASYDMSNVSINWLKEIESIISSATTRDDDRVLPNESELNIDEQTSNALLALENMQNSVQG